MPAGRHPNAMLCCLGSRTSLGLLAGSLNNLMMTDVSQPGSWLNVNIMAKHAGLEALRQATLTAAKQRWCTNIL